MPTSTKHQNVGQRRIDEFFGRRPTPPAAVVEEQGNVEEQENVAAQSADLMEEDEIVDDDDDPIMVDLEGPSPVSGDEDEQEEESVSTVATFAQTASAAAAGRSRDESSQRLLRLIGARLEASASTEEDSGWVVEPGLRIVSVQFDATGALLAVAATDGSIRVYDFDEWRIARTNVPVLEANVGAIISEVRWSPVALDELVVALAYSPVIYVFDVQAGLDQRRELRPRGGATSGGVGHYALSFVPTSRTSAILVGGGANGRLRGWRRDAQASSRCCWDFEITLSSSAATTAASKKKNKVCAVCCAHGGLIVAATESGLVGGWDSTQLSVKAFGGGEASPVLKWIWRTTTIVACLTQESRTVLAALRPSGGASRTAESSGLWHLDAHNGRILGRVDATGPPPPESENPRDLLAATSLACGFGPFQGTFISLSARHPDLLRLSTLDHHLRSYREVAAIQLCGGGAPTAIAAHPDSGHVLLAFPGGRLSCLSPAPVS